MQRHVVHNMHHKKLMYNGQEKKPFKTSVIHCCQTNTHFFYLKWQKGWEVGRSCCTVRQETKPESRDDRENWYPLKCTPCPGSILFERSSFLASFAVSEVRKTYLPRPSALHCTALHCTIQLYVNCGGVLQILIYSQDMHHTFLYVSLLKSLHYDNLRFVNFTVYGGREPQDNDFHFSFTQRESTPLESNRRKMRQHLRNWATRNNSNEVLKKSMNTVLGGRFFAPYSRLTLRRFWSRYCFYYHFAKKHKIYILN